jgi:hypothetical protein
MTEPPQPALTLYVTAGARTCDVCRSRVSARGSVTVLAPAMT